MTEQKLDIWMRIFADEQRRAAIGYLRKNGEASLTELAEYVTERTRSRPGAPSPPEYDRTLTSLYHVHLPLMDDADVVDWDHEEKRVRDGGVTEDAPVEIDV